MQKTNFYARLFVISLLCVMNINGFQANSSTAKKSSVKNQPELVQNSDIAAKVKKAFDAVRKNGGGADLLDDLKQFGEKVIPYLRPYLDDKNIDVRRESVYLATEIGGEKSFDFLAEALGNSEPEIPKAVSKQVYLYYSQYRKFLPVINYIMPSESVRYKNFSPEKIAANPQFGKTLRESFKKGNDNLSTIYLLANFPDCETENFLKEIQKNPAKNSDSIKLASKIVLSGFEDQTATGELISLIEKNDLKTLVFLLRQINEIESTKILKSLMKTFDNKSDITGGKGVKNPHKKLPNGIHVDFLPERRLCDLAVNSFVERFHLTMLNNKLNRKISFGIHTTTYQDKQIAEVRKLVKLIFE